MQEPPSIPIHGADKGATNARDGNFGFFRAFLRNRSRNPVEPEVVANSERVIIEPEPLIDSGVDCILLDEVQQAKDVIWSNELPNAVDQGTYFPGNLDLQDVWTYPHTICYTGAKNGSFGDHLPPPMPPHASLERVLTFVLPPILMLVAIFYLLTGHCYRWKEANYVRVSGKKVPLPEGPLNGEMKNLRLKLAEVKEELGEAYVMLEEHDNTKTALAKAHSESFRLRQEIRSLESRRGENDSLPGVVKAKLFGVNKDRFSSIANEEDNYEFKYEELRGSLTEAIQQRDDEIASRKDTQQKLDTLILELKMKTEEVAKDQQTSESTQVTLSTALNSLNSMQSQLTSTQEALTSTQEKLDTAEKALETKQDESSINRMKDQMKALEKKLDTTRQTLESTQSSVGTLKARLISVEEERDCAVARGQGLVTAESDQTLKHAADAAQIEYLKKELDTNQMILQLTQSDIDATNVRSTNAEKRVAEAENQIQILEQQLNTAILIQASKSDNLPGEILALKEQLKEAQKISKAANRSMEERVASLNHMNSIAEKHNNEIAQQSWKH